MELIFEIIHTFFHTVYKISTGIFHIPVIIRKQYPCFLDFRKHFYRFRENVAISILQCMEDIFCTVETFIGYLDGSAGYGIPLFEVLNDVSDHRLFTLISREQFHADRYLVGIEEKA